MQKGIGSSLYLHIHKPKKSSRPQSGEDFFGLGMCKHKLEQTTFCTCQNLNPNTLSSSKLLPTKQRRNRFVFFVYGCANASLNKFPFARATTAIQRHVHLHSCYPQTKNVPPRLQKQNFTNCVLHSARTVHAQCTPQCTATKRCKYHGIGVLLTIYKKNYKNIFFFCVF